MLLNDFRFVSLEINEVKWCTTCWSGSVLFIKGTVTSPIEKEKKELEESYKESRRQRNTQWIIYN